MAPRDIQLCIELTDDHFRVAPKETFDLVSLGYETSVENVCQQLIRFAITTRGEKDPRGKKKGGREKMIRITKELLRHQR